MLIRKRERGRKREKKDKRWSKFNHESDGGKR